MIDEHGRAVAVYHIGSVADAKQVSRWRILIFLIGLVFGDARSRVFNHARAFFDWRSGVAACRMDGGRTNDKGHI